MNDKTYTEILTEIKKDLARRQRMELEKIMFYGGRGFGKSHSVKQFIEDTKKKDSRLLLVA